MGETRTLPDQLAFHLLDSSHSTLAITRIVVALSELLGASSEDVILSSELMSALMAAAAKPVVSVLQQAESQAVLVNCQQAPVTAVTDSHVSSLRFTLRCDQERLDCQVQVYMAKPSLTQARCGRVPATPGSHALLPVHPTSICDPLQSFSMA